MNAEELTDAVALVGACRVAKEAVQTFGEPAQLRQVQEECGELIAAINRDARGRDHDRTNLIEEAGQVFVLLLQAREILGHERFDASVRAAVEKTKAKLKSHQDKP